MTATIPASTTRPPVAVIGAGPAGLSAATALRRRGVPAVVLEQGPQVGMSWRNRHRELRLNTVRWLSAVHGSRIPRSAGRWVSRDEYVRHLSEHALRERLDVWFGTQVRQVRRVDGAWQLHLSDGVVPASHVVVATGHDRVPVVPRWPGAEDFMGRITHVSGVRSATELTGQRVVLVGAGNSGIEMAGHLVDAGVQHLWLSVRTPPNILPREFLGLPVHPAAVITRHLPERLRDEGARLIARRSFGDLAPFGLPAPDQGPFERMRTTGVTAAVDQGFVHHLRAGRITVVPEVERLTARSVVLRGGRVIAADAVVTATGFRPGLDELVGHLGILDADGLPDPAAAEPLGLWFLGFRPALEGNLRQHPVEATRIARAIKHASVRGDAPVAAEEARR